MVRSDDFCHQSLLKGLEIAHKLNWMSIYVILQSVQKFMLLWLLLLTLPSKNCRSGVVLRLRHPRQGVDFPSHLSLSYPGSCWSAVSFLFRCLDDNDDYCGAAVMALKKNLISHLQKLAYVFEAYRNFRGKLSPKVSKDGYLIDISSSNHYFGKVSKLISTEMYLLKI